METGDAREQYILDKILDKILSIRTRLDRLIFILLAFSLVGIANIKPPTGDGLLSYIDIVIPEKHYNITIALVLLGTFAMIGSQLIDYIRKRHLLDIYAGKYLTEIGSEERSDILVPASFYDFMYELDLMVKNLRLHASLVLLLIFYFSHFVAFLHLLYVTEDLWATTGLFAFFITVYLLCYRTFVMSIPPEKPRLRWIIRTSIFALLGVSLLVIYLLFGVIGLGFDAS